MKTFLPGDDEIREFLEELGSDEINPWHGPHIALGAVTHNLAQEDFLHDVMGRGTLDDCPSNGDTMETSALADHILGLPQSKEHEVQVKQEKSSNTHFTTNLSSLLPPHGMPEAIETKEGMAKDSCPKDDTLARAKRREALRIRREKRKAKAIRPDHSKRLLVSDNSPEQKLQELEAQLAQLDPNCKDAGKQRRLIRNRISAQLHRERQRAFVENLQGEIVIRDTEINKLNTELQILKAENKSLRTALKQYEASQMSKDSTYLKEIVTDTESGSSSSSPGPTSPNHHLPGKIAKMGALTAMSMMITLTIMGHLSPLHFIRGNVASGESPVIARQRDRMFKRNLQLSTTQHSNIQDEVEERWASPVHAPSRHPNPTALELSYSENVLFCAHSSFLKSQKSSRALIHVDKESRALVSVKEGSSPLSSIRKKERDSKYISPLASKSDHVSILLPLDFLLAHKHAPNVSGEEGKELHPIEVACQLISEPEFKRIRQHSK